MPDEKKKPTTADLLPELQKQFDYIKSYASSPKYQERLSKMINSERQIQAPLSPQRFQNEVMAPYKTDQPTRQVAAGIAADNVAALNSLAKNKIGIDDYDLGHNVAGGYDSSYNDIRLQKDLVQSNPTVPVHELSHGMNDGRQPYTQNFADKYLKNIFVKPTDSRFEAEVQKPTEVKARLDAVRYLGNKTGLFDAGRTNFTAEDFKKIQGNKEIKNDFNFKQIMSQLPKGKEAQSFIWLMNNIAKNDMPNVNNDMA